MVSNVNYADESAIRELYQRMLDAWGDAVPYAECFTPDAHYIIANGMVERGWKEIVDGHEIIFSGWARDSRLEGQLESIRFLTPDVAVLTAYGHIVYLDDRSSHDNRRTIYTLIALRTASGWHFAGYQNTPIGGHE